MFEEVVELLTGMDIEPLGALSTLPAIVESRVWTQPADASEVEASAARASGADEMVALS